VVTEDIHNEWYEIKAVYYRMKLKELLKSVLTKEKRCMLLCKIISIVTILPTSRAYCEREESNTSFKVICI
jgi:hypothetical protein